MKLQRLIPVFIIITAIGILYDKYKEKYDPEPEKVQFDLIQKYLLNDVGTDKPLMWIYTEYNINARHWKSFGSRNTEDLNQPYIHMCIETIIKHCGNDFNICLINEESFDKLLKDWTINIHEITKPIKSRIVKLGLFRILYKYGGVLIPNSTIMMENFKPLHKRYLGNRSCYVGEFVCRNITSDMKKTFPDMKLMGCQKRCNVVKELCNYLEVTISVDNTSETDFLGNLDRKIFELVNRGQIAKIPGNFLGTKDVEGEPILIDELLENTNIKFDKHMSCLYLPEDEIKKRRKYNWFLRSNKIQILSSNTNAAKMFVKAYSK
jgi:hypothetical protein